MILGRDFLRQHRVPFARSQKKRYISYVGNGGGVFVSQPTRIEPWLQREADEGNPNAGMWLASAYGSGKLAAKDPVARFYLGRIDATALFAQAAAGHDGAGS